MLAVSTTVPVFDLTMNMPLCTVPPVLVLAMMKSPARSMVAAPIGDRPATFNDRLLG